MNFERSETYENLREVASGESYEWNCKAREVVWVCLNCGNLIWDTCAPETCPVCSYPRGYYQVNCEND